MYLSDTGLCAAGSPNPFEDEKRDGTCTRNGGSFYAPFLLPSGYEKNNSDGSVTLYYSFSTWNPYQSVLMDTLTVNLQ